MVAIKEDTLNLGEELGQGEFGSVLRGTYRAPDGKVLNVAVKTLRVDAMGHGEQVSGYGTWGTGEWVWDLWTVIVRIYGCWEAGGRGCGSEMGGVSSIIRT